ncbi:TonB-dependent receptor plug domain-containing protein [Sabulilitoribacter multivorans]|uniref:TonB-dependent receptor plug domain-containing protein n=1 Tax=Flaviramulus multivorans TaxID=1304750 RepID=A0ABS9IMC3_9FLAO|nr:TonB-dependent receptor plug domain-containing protein [Flaviramulus multivorans]MCF7561745.1 TonB-dependent receptor plug domain-containing protein [Flaviramulus multivorans]
MINLFKKASLLVFLLLFVSISYSQERIVTGQVTTFKKIAVVNAEIKVQSSKVTVLTDTTGYFKVSCSPKDKIKISANGFISQKIKLDEKTNDLSINLKFKPSEKNIDVAIGYGHIKEKDKTFSLTSIRSETNSQFAQFSNIIDIILNSSPSIAIKNGEIIIRGESSLNGSSAALILVNGSEVNMSQLSAIQPLDVKSIDILKGSGGAIYGVRGANGVVLITLK